MRLATWNVNGLRARLDLVRRWLADRAPDVVGLQELKLTDEQFPHDAFEELGYRALAHGQKSWNGVAVLSREPAELLHTGLAGQEGFGARLLGARVGGISFTTVYCPNGKHVEHDDFARKLEWFDALAAHWRAQHAEGDAAVLCGDFNIVPAALDTWHGADDDESIFHTPAERARMARLVDLGLTDLFRHAHPEAREYSWWDYRGGSFHRGHGLRIDLVLATAPVRDRLRAAWIDRDYRKKLDGLTASDHAPVIADID
ncbi:MAG: exodeoxyribonuclease III [Myxococcota bacterium]